MKMPVNPFAAAATNMLMLSSHWFATMNKIAKKNEEVLTKTRSVKRRPSSAKTPRSTRQATAG